MINNLEFGKKVIKDKNFNLFFDDKINEYVVVVLL